MSEGSSPITVAVIAGLTSIATAAIGYYAAKQTTHANDGNYLKDLVSKVNSLQQNLYAVQLERDLLKQQASQSATTPNRIDMSSVRQPLTIADDVCVNAIKAKFDGEGAKRILEGSNFVDYAVNGDHVMFLCASDEIIASVGSEKRSSRDTMNETSDLLLEIASAQPKPKN